MVKRTKHAPKLTLSFWKTGATGHFSADRRDVLDTILKNGFTSEELNKAMGQGIHLLNELIDGEELDLWGAYFVDCAIRPKESPQPQHSYPPLWQKEKS